VIPGSDCYSLIGPQYSIRFSDSVIMWATFYHLMLRDRKRMNATRIRKTLATMKQTFGRTFTYL
jgi:hypothetical protein